MTIVNVTVKSCQSPCTRPLATYYVNCTLPQLFLLSTVSQTFLCAYIFCPYFIKTFSFARLDYKNIFSIIFILISIFNAPIQLQTFFSSQYNCNNAHNNFLHSIISDLVNKNVLTNCPVKLPNSPILMEMFLNRVPRTLWEPYIR